MDENAHLNEILQKLINSKSAGTTLISTDEILSDITNRLNSLGAPPSNQIEIEAYKANLQEQLEGKKYLVEAVLESHRSVISFANSAIRAALLLNGGAAIAMLAFVARLASDKSANVTVFAKTIEPFAIGAGAAAAIPLAAYVA